MEKNHEITEPSTFFPFKEESQFDGDLTHFMCIDDNYTEMKGNYQSQVAWNLWIILERCHIQTDEGIPCKTSEEIDDYLDG